MAAARKNFLLRGSKSIYSAVMLLIMGLVFFSCANPVAPTGGPLDETPPKVTQATPPNYSTEFQGGEVRIFFDEFVQLNDLSSKFLVSPPMEKLPEVRIRGRSIIMSVVEPLRENTTYNFFFGDAIRDITENNPMPNFQYVVSTGNYVDSLSLKGRVLDAFTLEPMERVYVMLYDDYNDSIPYLERPVYISLTDEHGFYTINNMREGDYKIFALNDVNANFLYDLPNEKIAFLDSLITPAYIEPPLQESEQETLEDQNQIDGEEESLDPGQNNEQQPGEEFIKLEQTQQPASGQNDTLSPADPGYVPPADGDLFTMFMFQEPDTLQRIISSSLVKKGLIQIILRVPADSVWVNEIRQPFDNQWYIPELLPGLDTLRLWFADVDRDTLFLEVGDSFQVLDTLRLSTTPRVARGRQADNDVPLALNLEVNASRTRPLSYFKPLMITAENPVTSWDMSKIQLMEADSILMAPELEFFDEPGRVVATRSLPEPGRSYTLALLPGAFTDIFGIENDSISVQFNTTSPEDYGTLVVNLELPHQNNQFVLQLLDKDGVAVAEKFVYSDGAYYFNDLNAATFGMRLIDDRNNNGRWNTGNYLKGLQPEPVFIFPPSIQLRVNWEMEVSWAP